jgi:hypothetical protein
MARYIDADKFIAELEQEKTVDLEFEDGVAVYEIEHTMNLIGMQPTADVVPKSEVENILDELMKEIREIAERYEKSANETSDYDYARLEYRGCQLGALLVLLKIAELKKKYTEEKENENKD